jgi:hypothetical protein
MPSAVLFFSIPYQLTGGKRTLLVDDANDAPATQVVKLHGSLSDGVKGVVVAPLHIETGVKARTALAHDDGTGNYLLATEHLDAQSLRLGVPAVA